MQRLDRALVERGLARSRTHAHRLVTDQHVRVDDALVTKPATPVATDSAISVTGADPWVSRGAHKIIGALDAFGISVAGRTALDAGSSTGGFTQVLLSRGARRVAAVDVGTNQLASTLATDPRVIVRERTNLRDIDAAAVAALHDELGSSPTLITADLSFISLTLVLPILSQLAAPEAELLPMVKPQFEVGKGRLGAHGVVRDQNLRAQAVETVAQAAFDIGWGIAGVTSSPLPGPTGNQEYFLHLKRDAARDMTRARAMIVHAVQEGVR